MLMLHGKRHEVDRVPCINSVGTYTVDFMKACDAYWPFAHKDPEKMAKLASAAHRLCGLDNVSVPFDMTIEAEALGATINFHENTLRWPSIREFIKKDLSDLTLPQDVSKTGRIPLLVKAIEILKKEFHGKVPVNAFIAPPFTSISSYVVDTITFLKSLRTDPPRVHALLKGVVDFYAEIARLYQDAGADVITFHEMGGSTDNISPKHFEEFIVPYIKEVSASLKVPTILNICGSALPIIGKMLECGTNAIAIDERTPISKAKEVAEKANSNCVIIGNIPPHEIIHKGPVDAIRDAVRRAIEEGADMLAPGCDFWLETPTEHVKAFVDAAIEFGTPPPWVVGK
jgi:[methyl-Co(III) methanol-specific corrinoid protein]:coenzyme M methyltransferase